MQATVNAILILCAIGMLFILSVGVELFVLDMGGTSRFKLGYVTGWDFKAYTYISSIGWFLTLACFLYFRRNPPGDDNILDL